jgi:hypothetical protein
VAGNTHKGIVAEFRRGTTRNFTSAVIILESCWSLQTTHQQCATAGITYGTANEILLPRTKSQRNVQTMSDDSVLSSGHRWKRHSGMVR